MDVHGLKQFESVYQPSKEIAFCWLRKQYVQLSIEENHSEVVDHANDSLRIWQAAKAQAIPEGFVLVPVDTLEECLNWADIAKWDSPSNEVDKKIAHHEAIIESAISAQEPTND